jgi:hypothetical protein
MAAADQRQCRQEPGELGEHAEQRIAGAEQGARTNDRSSRKRLLNHQFAASSRTDVRRA